MNVSVIGLGKLGLPLAVQFASKECYVTGIDLNQNIVDSINAGICPIKNETDLEQKFSKAFSTKRLIATTNFAEGLSKVEVIVVVVPLYIDEASKPDYSALDSCVSEIARNLPKNVTICIETTLPIGTTRERVKHLIEIESSKKEGVDFFLVFSPERVLTGRVFADLRKYPKIVGGVSEVSGQKGVDFYRKVLEFDVRNDLEQPNGVWLVENSDAAEFVKLAETTYRDVNIGLANQFSKLAHRLNIDINPVLSAANSQPFSNIHIPGISVGGHCIPVYPVLYLQSDPDASIVKTARQVNSEMPNYAIELLEKEVEDLRDKLVLVVGVTYRSGSKESYKSGASVIKKLLETKQAKVIVTDPLYSREELESLGFEVYDPESHKPEIMIVHTVFPGMDEKFFASFDKLKFVLNGRSKELKIPYIDNVSVISI
jgi:nucleotide sugar dehydrogenase